MGKKSSQYKKILGAFFICLIAFGIILAQYYIRQKTTTKSQAAKTAVLSFSQPQKPVNAGDTFNVDVMLTPGNNKITAVKLVIGYNPNILEQGNPGLIPNTNVFPQIFEGPVYNQCFSNSCVMSVSLSVGTDLTKVVQGQTPATIATVQFKALQATDKTGTAISFDNGTIVLSLSPSDEPSENVANLTPVSIPIGGSVASPSAGFTTATIALHFEGIDINNNPVPKHPQRQTVLSFYKDNNFTNSPDFTIPFRATYNKNNEFVNNTINLSQVIPGPYYILVKSPEGSLREALNDAQAITIVTGQNNKLTTGDDPKTTTALPLRMGDLDNDNSVDVKDYSILIDCYGKKQSGPTCTKHKTSDTTKGLFVDLNDDNLVNGIDYNILIRHFGEQGY